MSLTVERKDKMGKSRSRRFGAGRHRREATSVDKKQIEHFRDPGKALDDALTDFLGVPDEVYTALRRALPAGRTHTHRSIRSAIEEVAPAYRSTIPNENVPADPVLMTILQSAPVIMIKWKEGPASLHPFSKTTIDALWPHFRRSYRDTYRTDREARKALQEKLLYDKAV